MVVIMSAPMPAAITDHRLKPALDAILAGRVKLLSIDVFDTLLWRKVPEPKDVFLVLGRRLADAGQLAPHVSPVMFAELRAKAETTAREKRQAATGSREIVLADIYDQMRAFLFATGVKPSDVAAAEVACEEKLMTSDHDLLTLVETAKAKGLAVWLMSDTYFSSAEIAKFMARSRWKGLGPIDRLIVSCEAGRPKWRDLFDHLLADGAVQPSAWLHIGDNIDADIVPCQRLGIGCLHYDKWAFSHRAKNREFSAQLPMRSLELRDHGDFGLTGLRSRLWHRAPTDLSPTHRFFWSYGASVMAPAFAAFARWIVQSADDAQVDGVYGLMREGRFLKRVVDLTAQQLGVPPKFKELWLSRRAIIRAALYPGEHDLISEYVLAAPGRTTEDILSNMGLTHVDLAQASPDLATFDATQPEAFVTMIKAVMMHPALRAKIDAKSASLRPRLLKGLGKTIPMRAPSRIMVVDLGYTATIQTVLQRVLQHEGLPVSLTGLYFALNDKAITNVLNGVDLQSYLSPEGFASDAAQVLTRTPDVLEHACMCDEGSLADFDESGEPLLLPNRRSEKQLAEMHAMQDGIIEGVRAINELLGSLTHTPAVGNDTLARQVGCIITEAMLRPTADEAKHIGAWRHEAKVDAMPTMSFSGTTFDFNNLEYGGWVALQSATRDQIYWPGAAFQIADVSVGEAYANGVQRAYGAKQLLSNPLLGGLAICPDLGVGFDQRREGKVALNVNSFGRGFVAATIKGMSPEAYKSLRLTWPATRAVIQIDRASVTVTTARGAKSTDLVPAGQVTWSGTSPLPGGAMMAERQAVAMLNVEELAPAEPHSLDIELRFKYLQLDSILGAG
jgi:FMN phosphatase YigB (HAD superfamily)